MTRPLLVVLRALGLGDYLTGLPALRALRRHFPDHRRVLLAPGWLEPLARSVAPSDEFRAHPGLVPLPDDLVGAEVAVDLHGRGPESQPLLLSSKPRSLICFRHPDVPGTEHGAQFVENEHEVRRWCRLLTDHGILADAEDLLIEPPTLEIEPMARGATVLHPGASSESRRWPLERFVAVGRHELARGRRVVVTGSAGEKALVLRLAMALGLPPPSRVIGSSLLELAQVLAEAGRVVVGDTGVSHLATALATPSVVLCGPVDPRLWGPLEGIGPHIALWSGRQGDPHATKVDPGLAALTTSAVIDALEQLDELEEASTIAAPQQSIGPLQTVGG